MHMVLRIKSVIINKNWFGQITFSGRFYKHLVSDEVGSDRKRWLASLKWDV